MKGSFRASKEMSILTAVEDVERSSIFSTSTVTYENGALISKHDAYP